MQCNFGYLCVEVNSRQWHIQRFCTLVTVHTYICQAADVIMAHIRKERIRFPFRRRLFSMQLEIDVL